MCRKIFRPRNTDLGLVTISNESLVIALPSGNLRSIGVRTAMEKYEMRVHTPVSGLHDILEANLRVVFCGINPGMSSAVAGHHFVNRSNRFWRVLHRSGFTPNEIGPPDATLLLKYGCGLTSAVERATVSAGELTKLDFQNARPGLELKMRRYHPRCLAFLGKAACSSIFNQRNILWGRQTFCLGKVPIWVLPNPSGLNRAFSLESLVAAYQELFEALKL
jgi:TDG/mug DNA glycosylase family protein